MSKAYKAAVSGILLALSVAISAIETNIPLPVGVKPGFSNLPVMLSMSYMNTGISFSIVLLKSIFVLLTRGITAFFMSISGGLFSFFMMLVIYKKMNSSFLLTGLCGGITHNIGQITAASIIMNNTAVFSYLPVLLISGCAAGMATGITANLLIPKIKPIFRRNK